MPRADLLPAFHTEISEVSVDDEPFGDARRQRRRNHARARRPTRSSTRWRSSASSISSCPRHQSASGPQSAPRAERRENGTGIAQMDRRANAPLPRLPKHNFTEMRQAAKKQLDEDRLTVVPKAQILV